MKNVVNLALLVGFSLALAPPLNAQLYKVAVSGQNISATDEFNPQLWPGVVTFTAEVDRVSYNGRRVPQSVFNLVVSNQGGAVPTLRFDGIALAAGSELSPAPAIGCRYPGFTGGTFPQCMFDFINLAGPHPRHDYGSTRLTAGFKGIDFTSMPVGEPQKGLCSPSAAFAIYATNDCLQPKNAGVGLSFDPVHPDNGGSTAIVRTSENTWEVSVSQQVAVLQWAFDWKTIYLKSGRQSQSCSAYMSPAHAWTTPVQFKMTVTRIK